MGDDENLLSMRSYSPPTPGSQDSNTGKFFTEAHKQEWNRILKESFKKTDSFVEIAIKFILHLIDIIFRVPLVFEVFFSSENREETVWELILYIFTCIVTVAVQYTSRSDASKTKSVCSIIKTLGLNVFMFTKFGRYYASYQSGKERRKLISEQTENGVITSKVLKSLAEVNAREVESKKMELYEVFFQTIPMAFLQMHLKFHVPGYSVFRVVTIVTPCYQGAIAASSFESAKALYEQCLHLLQFHESKGDHPMAIFATGMLSMEYWFCVCVHFLTILSRAYTMFYIYSTSSFTMSIIFLALLLIVNEMMYYNWPHCFLDVHENPPHGMPTIPSRIADRLVNIFCSLSGRHRYFVVEVRGKQLFHAPYVGFLTLIPYVFSCLIVYFLNVCFKSIQIQPDRLFTKSWSVQAFEYIFGLTFVNVLLCYLAVVSVGVYAVLDLNKRSNGKKYLFPIYPVVTGYAYYKKLVDYGIQSNDASLVRKFMVLHLLTKDEFYGMLKSGPGACNYSRVVEDESLESARLRKIESHRAYLQEIPERLSVDQSIDRCIEKNHKFKDEFEQLKAILVRNSDSVFRNYDKHLFSAFYGYFDTKLVGMSSHRIQKTFELMGRSYAKRNNFSWEEKRETDSSSGTDD